MSGWGPEQGLDQHCLKTTSLWMAQQTHSRQVWSQRVLGESSEKKMT